MSDLDQQSEDVRGKGGPTQIIGYDPRLSSGIRWVWTTFGAIALLIGTGTYNKLSDMNDTLIEAVSKLETQGNQIIDLRVEVAKQRDEIAALRAQVFMLEGKTLRGIAEASRGN
jgi:hypothetical protein